MVTWKKGTQEKYVPYADVVEEALCYGWIDGLPRKLDAERTMLFLSPRRPRSVWSALNKERIARLESMGAMTEAGRAKIEAAKKDGSWNTLDASDALQVPTDLASALATSPAAQKHFAAFPPGARKMILEWVLSARTAPTRAQRIDRTVTLAAQNIRSRP